MKLIATLFSTALFLTLSLIFSLPAQAQITCAQVRCENGVCVDTQRGPICQVRPTCPMITCAPGYQCREDAYGPQCVAGQPEVPQFCTSQYKPVCAEKNGERQTFGNECEAQEARANILWEGTCDTPGLGEVPQYCAEVYAPVCAVKGDQHKTFGNECKARQALHKPVYDGECRNTSSEPKACPRNYDPVCGLSLEGFRTYGNRCEAERERAQVLYGGECR